MKSFRNHKYCWTKPFTAVRHEWSLVGAQMAVSFHVSVLEGHEDTAGLEIHYFHAPDYMRDNAPSHIDCPYTGGRCWHDGTSLYATETLWPLFKTYLAMGDHESIFRALEREIVRRDTHEENEESPTPSGAKQ